ncbi:hypothetical protein OE88DRAFT_1664196 [Heliocybe sulcata]|uniref:UBX domain-containing protein n=1 Tax=Heliocybe sulcata TaxID=5364 RepID=A0A5C3MUF5_9AGAM|nr:hypothetical protein OE88DRAFT_1664196 [Heliocybe sulcata]
MSGDKDVLLSMGFDPARVEWALRATSGRGLQPAMDHILEHENDPIPDPSASAPAAGSAGNPMDVDENEEDIEALKAAYGKANIAPAVTPAESASGSAAPVEAKSIKCLQCEKLFKNVDLANYHAEKSGHDQFEESVEEIKPLTEEEKKQKLEELRKKMAEKRARKAEEDAKADAANNAIRRKAGKDMGQVKEDLAAKQAIKEAEAKRREKLEDAKARAAIKAQIEADKRERAAKAAREKALREGKTLEAAPLAASSKPVAAAGEKKEFKETRLQIRLASGGTPYTTTLPSEAPLREVAEYLAGQTLAVNVDTVTFSTTFPRKQFSQADMSRTLRELGLTPSAVLMAS